MYVVDYMRHTVSAYDKEGKYLFEFGGLGWGEGWFQYPRDIAVDSSGRILIADTFNNRIQVFQAKE
jgi:DNA-binding beta-propeller fold protein YncE